MSEISLLPEVRAFLARDHGHFIDGQYIGGTSGLTTPIVNRDRRDHRHRGCC